MGISLANKSVRHVFFIVLSIFKLCQSQDHYRIPVGGRWHLECPKVGDRATDDRVTVTWTQNNAIWLKIENSNVTIGNQLMSLQRSRMGASNILNIVSNHFRYKFYYDETVGSYELTISNAEPEDSGLWVCYVALERIRGAPAEEFTSDGYLIVGKSVLSLPSVSENKDITEDDVYNHGGQIRGQGKSKQGQRQKLADGSGNLNATANATATTNGRTLFPIILLSLSVATARGTF